MSRNPHYQRFLNRRRWKELRAWKLTHNPLCEMCQAKGKVVAAVDVHHIRPVESANTLKEMEQLCYDHTNLMSLCIQCHSAIHKAERSHSRQAHQQREADRLARWAASRQPPSEEKPSAPV